MSVTLYAHSRILVYRCDGCDVTYTTDRPASFHMLGWKVDEGSEFGDHHYCPTCLENPWDLRPRRHLRVLDGGAA